MSPAHEKWPEVDAMRAKQKVQLRTAIILLVVLLSAGEIARDWWKFRAAYESRAVLKEEIAEATARGDVQAQREAEAQLNELRLNLKYAGALWRW